MIPEKVRALVRGTALGHEFMYALRVVGVRDRELGDVWPWRG